MYFGDVAEIDRRATGRRSDGDTADFLDGAKLTRGDNRDVPSSGVNLPARGRDVSRVAAPVGRRRAKVRKRRAGSGKT